jgi:hypothetical protein
MIQSHTREAWTQTKQKGDTRKFQFRESKERNGGAYVRQSIDVWCGADLTLTEEG